MSTKLYDGLRLTEHASDLFEVTRLVSRRMREVFAELRLPIVAKEVARVVDDPAARSEDLPPRFGTVFARARKHWIDEQRAMDRMSTFQDPLRFTIVFGEVFDEHGRRRLAYPFYGDRSYYDALRELRIYDRPVFADYEYQTSTDRPERIDEEAWARRGRDWDQVMTSGDDETDGSFAHLPMWQLPNTIDHVFDRGMWSLDEHDLNEVVTVEERLRRLLRDQLASRMPRPEASPSDYSAVLALMHAVGNAVTEYLASDAGAELEHPAPLPSDLTTRISELPEPYRAPEEALEQMQIRAVELLEPGQD